MAKGFFDIPLQEAEPTPAKDNALLNGAKQQADAAQQRADALQLKASITEQLKAGVAPQTILLSAVELIGILTHDESFTTKAKAELEKVYEDPEQISFFQNELEKKKLLQQQADYNGKLRRTLKRQRAAYRKLDALMAEMELSLEDAVSAVGCWHDKPESEAPGEQSAAAVR